MKKLTYEQALHRLAAYCSRAEKCLFDIRQKLEKWEIEDSDQKKLIAVLQKEKYLDEERFCCAFVHDKSQYNRWGYHKIKFELKKKQLPEDLISKALQTLDSKETSKQLLDLLKQKRPSVKGKDEYEIREKLMRFAAGRGYAIEDIKNCLSIL